jgi:serine/threonine protein kinase
MASKPDARLSGISISTEDPKQLFTLQEKLGKGAYGHVYKAANKTTGETVAIKIISLDVSDSLDDVRREIEILSECHHPNIVNYLGSYLKGNDLWVNLKQVLPSHVSFLLTFLIPDSNGILWRRFSQRNLSNHGKLTHRKSNRTDLSRNPSSLFIAPINHFL